MRKIKRFISRIYDLPNAFRVLDIMDECGANVERDERFSSGDCWKVTVPWYLTEKEADDLITIVLYKRQYKKRSKFWKKYIFRNYHHDARILRTW